MAHEPAVEQQSSEPIEASASKSKSGLFKLIKTVAFVSVIVVVEIVTASMLAPKAQQTERLAHEIVAAETGKTTEAKEAGEHADSHGEAHDLREVELGVYNVTRYNPTSNTTMAVDFELYGTVLAENEAEFQHHYEHSQARLREQVIMTLHGVESADLTDAGLGLIKRRILEKTNRALGQPLVQEVLFSKFNFVER
jgi:flagellar basal body-associated protein FliL